MQVKLLEDEEQDIDNYFYEDETIDFSKFKNMDEFDPLQQLQDGLNPNIIEAMKKLSINMEGSNNRPVSAVHKFRSSSEEKKQKLLKPKNNIPPLSNIYKDLEKVGILADEFDDEDNNSEDEGIEDYKRGGYHPVFIGEILNDRYVILQKLGWGHFSTVWLARDTKHDTYVAIKVQKSASHYLEAAFDEVEILQKAVKCANDLKFKEDLKKIYKGERSEFGVDDCHVVQLLNAFIFNGPYGRHFCMVFEILGANLLEIIKRYEYKGIPSPICREIGRQVLIGLHYLHKYCGIIHTDLKPENVMVCLSDQELKEIYESGQLRTKEKINWRIKVLKKRLRALKGEEVSDEDELPPESLTSKYTNANNAIFEQEKKISDDNITFSNNVGPNSMQSSGIFFKTEEQLLEEYQNKLNNPGLNQKKKKNLKKQLKKKLKNLKNKTDKNSGFINENIQTKEQNNISKKIIPITPPEMHSNFYKSGLSPNFKIKIADLGNGCWIHHHFQPEIQTRQYRSPEVILGLNYNETTDIWSFACMFYEMITGEFLFDPRKTESWSKSTDHLCIMMEILKKFPKNYSTVGTNSKKFLLSSGDFKKISKLNHVTIKENLIRKYGTFENEAEKIQNFLLPMLDIYPNKRLNALESLNLDWFKEDIIEIFEDPTRENAIDIPNHQPGETESEFFNTVINEEELFADESRDENFNDSTNDSDDELYNQKDHPESDIYEKKCRYFDRDYRNVYVGFADGIDLNALDNTGNWQFDHNKN